VSSQPDPKERLKFHLDDLARDVRYTLRSLRRTPLVAMTIVATIALGLGLVAVVFTVLNAFIFRVDEVRNPHELFAVTHRQSANAPPRSFTRPQYEALLRETRVFSDAFATTPEIDAWIEGVRMEGPLVTGNFFRVLGVSAARGRTLTPQDDEPGGTPVIVLSHDAWSRHFGGDPGVLNRTVRINGTSFQVVGVMPQRFRGLAVFAPDFWAPLSLVGEFHRASERGENAIDLSIVGRLTTGIARAQALAQLMAWDSRRTAERPLERPAPSAVEASASLVLEPRPGTVPLSADAMPLFMPLFFAFGLILMIGCANVANLLLARGVARQREIGIRLAVGASRRRVIRQLIIESLLLALISAALAFGISQFVLGRIVYTITSTFPPDIGNLRLSAPPADWRVALFLVVAAMVSTVFFALAPAFQATRVELVRAIRGEVVRDGRPGRARNVLVALQVTGSVVLLICAAIFLRSSVRAAAIDPGIRTSGIVTVSVLDEQKRGAILDVVQSEPLVASVAGSWPGWLGGLPALAQGTRAKSAVRCQFVSPEHFGVFDIALVRGRGFTESERSASTAVAVVSESIARQLWPGADAIGQILPLEPDANTAVPYSTDGPRIVSRSVTVVGVARDVPGFRLGGFALAGADVYLPIAMEQARTSLTLRVHGDVARARYALVNRLTAIDPNMSEVETLETVVRAGSYLLKIPFWLTLMLGGLALLLTLSGLFSVLSYLVEQRSREIGVRMALGATRQMIAAHVLAQSTRPVGLGLLLGASFTAALGGVLLATPAAEYLGSIVRLFDPVAYGASLVCIIAACTCAALIPAVRAAQIDPVGAIRRD
jgi:predicted permease